MPGTRRAGKGEEPTNGSAHLTREQAGEIMAEHARQIDDVRGSTVYPGTGPLPPGNAIVRTPAALGHPEQSTTSRVTKDSVETSALLVGRAIVGGYFLYNGINHLINREMLAQYAQNKGVPQAKMAVELSGLMAIAGGVSVLTGVLPKVGGGLISTFVLGVSRMHMFWRERDPQQRMQEMVNFTKNMALVGAGLLLAAHPEPWPWAISGRSGQLTATSR